MPALRYPTVEYCVRALKLRSAGFSPFAIERCTGISHSLQDALLPIGALNRVVGKELDAHARDTVGAMSLDQLHLVQYAIDEWMRTRQRLPFARRSAPVKIELSDLLRKSSEAHTPSPDEAPPSAIKRQTYIGLSDEPMISESSVSLALRFMRMNAVSWSTAKQLIGMRLPKPQGRQVVVNFDGQLVPAHWSDTLDVRLFRALPYSASALLRETFRFCAQCLRGGFHSTVHQLSFVDKCPLHGLKLQEACVSCDSQVGPLEAMLSRGRNAYVCAACSREICGTSMTHLAYRQFRQALPAARSKLQPLISWLNQAQPHLWPLEQLLVQNAGSMTNWTQWGFSEKHTTHVAYMLHPLPPGFNASDAAGMETLPWSVALSDAHGNNLHSDDAQSSTTSTYLATLQAIADWVRGGAPMWGAGRHNDDFEFNSIIRPTSDASLRELALAYFRTAFEKPRPANDLSTVALPKLVDQHFRSIQASALPHSLPEKALFVGFYASILATMKLRKHEGFQRSNLAPLDPKHSVPFVFLPEAEGPARHLHFSEGAVFAPVTIGLPATKLYKGQI